MGARARRKSRARLELRFTACRCAELMVRRTCSELREIMLASEGAALASRKRRRGTRKYMVVAVEGCDREPRNAMSEKCRLGAAWWRR